MLKSETVLVLGAGASCNLGFLTGPQLLKKIGKALDIRQNFGEPTTGDAEILAAFRRISLDGDLSSLFRAAHRIRDAAHSGADNGNSIDNIIYQHEGNADVGLVAKIAIYKLILECEAACVEPGPIPKIAERKLKDSWYPIFADRLAQGINPTSLPDIFDRLSVINFNYDRSFEHFLPFSLATIFGIPMAEAEGLTAKLRIFHPYDSLGLLPWQTGAKQRLIFGNVGQLGVQPETLASAIRTFTEQIEEDSDIQAWRTLVHQAQKLVFIGFGFHDQNLDLLGQEAGAPTSNVSNLIGTTFGMPNPLRAMVMERLSVFTNGSRPLELPDLPAKEFLTQYGQPIMS